MTRLKILLADLLLIIVMVVAAAFLLATQAQASCYRHCVTNNYYETNNMTITNGVSDSELEAALTVTASAGGHQFDFSTTDWQGSIVGAWYEDESAVSFGVGKRFKEDFLPNTLLHMNYTQNGSEDLWVVGGTFRF